MVAAAPQERPFDALATPRRGKAEHDVAV